MCIPEGLPQWASRTPTTWFEMNGSIHAAVLSGESDLSDYVVEILNAWGMSPSSMSVEDLSRDLNPTSVPVLICPSGTVTANLELRILEFVRAGGTVLSFLPGGSLATTAGLTIRETATGIRGLRVTEFAASGLAGETLPVVGPIGVFETGESTAPLAYLCHPGSYQGESVGISATNVGDGMVISFAFDLALCILLLRQGDPARTEMIPSGDGCARPSHLAVEIGPTDASWIPFVDLLGKLLVDLALQRFPCPIPILYHLPGSTKGILLYSGDEDYAETSWNETDLAAVAASRGRMNLYIVPTRTKSTTEDVRRYLKHHDLGPHPDLRPLDGAPVTERLREFERQILLFESNFSIKARSLRNHCTAWAGYLESVEIMERLGVGMDANYFSGCYLRDRNHAPYAAFGSALPIRFCRPDGRILNVHQQHTHLTDDGAFGDAVYSCKLSPATFLAETIRMFTDISTRYHTPYGVCIHPSNWVKFSSEL